MLGERGWELVFIGRRMGGWSHNTMNVLNASELCT